MARLKLCMSWTHFQLFLICFFFLFFFLPFSPSSPLFLAPSSSPSLFSFRAGFFQENRERCVFEVKECFKGHCQRSRCGNRLWSSHDLIVSCNSCWFSFNSLHQAAVGLVFLSLASILHFFFPVSKLSLLLLLPLSLSLYLSISLSFSLSPCLSLSLCLSLCLFLSLFMAFHQNSYLWILSLCLEALRSCKQMAEPTWINIQF